MKLHHKSLYEIEDLDKVFDVDSLSKLVKNIVKYGKQQDPLLYPPLEYMGDCFEVFCEFFFKFFNGDSHLTFTANYEPNIDEDRGIDGRGTSTLDGGDCLVQIKFKADANSWLTSEERIGNFGADVTNEVMGGFKPNGRNCIIITTCQGVHPNHAVAGEAYHTINRKMISDWVDNNVVFWNDLKSVIRETYEVL